jgi:hypothetical protein
VRSLGDNGDKQPRERNGAFVLNAFDTLASRRDDTAAQRFWSADCSQRTSFFDEVAAMTQITRKTATATLHIQTDRSKFMLSAD